MFVERFIGRLIGAYFDLLGYRFADDRSSSNRRSVSLPKTPSI
jgi:hypothetical protein